MTKILALDLGTKTGFALLSGQDNITSGTANFKPSKFSGGGMRFVSFQRWVQSLHDGDSGLTEVYFESVRRHIGTDAAHMYGGFLACLTAFCEKHAIPYEGVPVGTIKKHATGKGNASKKEVIDAMRAKGFSPEDDNEADALALLNLIISRMET